MTAPKPTINNFQQLSFSNLKSLLIKKEGQYISLLEKFLTKKDCIKKIPNQVSTDLSKLKGEIAKIKSRLNNFVKSNKKKVLSWFQQMNKNLKFPDNLNHDIYAAWCKIVSEHRDVHFVKEYRLGDRTFYALFGKNSVFTTREETNVSIFRQDGVFLRSCRSLQNAQKLLCQSEKDLFLFRAKEIDFDKTEKCNVQIIKLISGKQISTFKVLFGSDYQSAYDKNCGPILYNHVSSPKRIVFYAHNGKVKEIHIGHDWTKLAFKHISYKSQALLAVLYGGSKCDKENQSLLLEFHSLNVLLCRIGLAESVVKKLREYTTTGQFEPVFDEHGQLDPMCMVAPKLILQYLFGAGKRISTSS